MFRKLAKNAWDSFKKVPSLVNQKEVFVGTDDYGNKFFEKLSDPSKGLKGQRRVEPRDYSKTRDEFQVPEVQTEWMTWLQGRRESPPTQQEIERNKVERMKIQMRAKELESMRKGEDMERDAEREQEVRSQTTTSFPKYEEYEYRPGQSKSNKDT